MGKYGIREQMLVKDLTWLMCQVDIKDILQRLGLEIDLVRGDWVRSYCPDHKLFTQRDPSHPKWEINTITGVTHCFSETRGSNIVYIVKRLRKCSIMEAIQWILNKDVIDNLTEMRFNGLKRTIINMKKPSTKLNSVELNDIEKDSKNRVTSKELYNFFIKPPRKSITNISKETVDYFKVFHRQWGWYGDRAIIPFFQKKKIVGFCAIDLLGVKEWEIRNKNSDREYRKVLYPSSQKGFYANRIIFGYDEVKKGCDYLILTEGAREVMKLWQEGETNSVALLHSFISDNQIKLISELSPKKIYIMMDGDNAGREGADRIYKAIKDFWDTSIIDLPEDKDPKNLSGKEIKKFISLL